MRPKKYLAVKNKEEEEKNLQIFFQIHSIVFIFIFFTIYFNFKNSLLFHSFFFVSDARLHSSTKQLLIASVMLSKLKNYIF